jgi:hypothetical protein
VRFTGGKCFVFDLNRYDCIDGRNYLGVTVKDANKGKNKPTAQMQNI